MPRTSTITNTVTIGVGTIDGGGEVIGLGGDLIVSGTVSGPVTVSSGGTITVAGGGLVSGAIVLNGGSVLNYGVDSGTVINNGGYESDYGSSVGLVVASGGTLFGYGAVSDISLYPGGLAFLHGGIGSGANINGTLELDGGASVGLYVQSGGKLLLNGGTIENVTVLSGGYIGGSFYSTFLGGSGSSYSVILQTGASGDVAAGVIFSGAVVSGGAGLSVEGRAFATQISSGGSVFVGSNGSAVGSFVYSGGQQNVGGPNAHDVSTTILAGGNEIVEGGLNFYLVKNPILEWSYVTDAQVDGGILTLSNYGSAYYGTIYNNGTEDISSGGADDSLLVSSGGSATVWAGGSATNSYAEQGGTLRVMSGAFVSAAEVDQGGTLELASGAISDVSATLLSAGAAILLDGVAYVSGTSAGFVSAGQDLAISVGGFVVQLSVAASEAYAGPFQVTAQGSNQTMVTLACFAAGTRIATARGLVAIEDLAIGDDLVLATGGTRPAIWLGHRHVVCANHPAPETQWPVRVTAHAFGPDCPAHDVLLSPEHAVFAEGCLIPIGALVNGATIRQEREPEITYWHVELDAHDVILAEGLPAESYLDNGDRDGFITAGSLSGPRAPIRRQGVAVENVRRRLEGRPPMEQAA